MATLEQICSNSLPLDVQDTFVYFYVSQRRENFQHRVELIEKEASNGQPIFELTAKEGQPASVLREIRWYAMAHCPKLLGTQPSTFFFHVHSKNPELTKASFLDDGEYGKVDPWNDITPTTKH